MNRQLEIQKCLIVCAKPTAIFKTLTDVENWNNWTTSVTKISLVKGARFAIGAKVKIVQPKLFPLVWTITEISDNHSFTWISNFLGLKIIAKHLIEDAGEFSIVRLITTYHGFLSAIIFSLTSRLTDRYMTMEIHGLKQAIERSGNRSSGLNLVPGEKTVFAKPQLEFYR